MIGRIFSLLPMLHLPHEQVDDLLEAGLLAAARGSRAAARAGGSSARGRSPRSGRRSSSFIVKSIGPTMRSRPRSRSQPRGRVEQRRERPRGPPRTRGSRTSPRRCRGSALKLRSTWALIRPTTRPSRRARNSSASPCLKKALKRGLRNRWRSSLSGGIQGVPVPCSRNGRSMNSRLSASERTGRTSTDTARHPTCPPPSISSTRPAATSAWSSCSAAREHDLMPYFRVVEAEPGPVALMEGARAHHARLEQLPRADRRPARQGGRPRGARALRHRPDRLALHERHHPAPPRARARAGRLDGHRGRARLHDRLPRQHRARSARCSTPATPSICDTGDHASILDAVALSRARVRPFRHNRLDKLESMLSRAESDGGGVLVVVDGAVLDGGRPVPAARRHGALPRARRAADGRRGARRRRARRAGRGRLRAARLRGRGRPAHGHLLQVARLLRRLHRRAARRDRLPARPVARVHVHRRRGARPPSARRWARCGSSAPTRARRCAPRCSTTRATCTRAWRRSATG